MQNEVILATAGSGKTSLLIDYALENRDRRILMTTYTDANTRELRSRFEQRIGLVPSNVQILTWFSFLLNHCLKPYVNILGDDLIVDGLVFQATLPDRVQRSNIRQYFFDSHSKIFADRASDLAVLINDKSSLVVNRLCSIFDDILVDEVQDLAGYDLELIECLLRSSLRITAVGDPRQSTYLTNHSAKNRQFRGAKIADWFAARSSQDLCMLKSLNDNYRCAQPICDFADTLYPSLQESVSRNVVGDDHTGIFLVGHEDVRGYVERFDPVVLRHNAISNTLGLEAKNFGECKGLTFDRVLIFPTSPMRQFLKSGDPSVAGDIARLYVAVTRARHSVAFAVPDHSFPTSRTSYWP